MWVTIPKGYRGRAYILFIEKCGYTWSSIDTDEHGDVQIYVDNVVDSFAFDTASQAFMAATMFLKNIVK